jgi:hypothetical protein
MLVPRVCPSLKKDGDRQRRSTTRRDAARHRHAPSRHARGPSLCVGGLLLLLKAVHKFRDEPLKLTPARIVGEVGGGGWEG